MTVESTDRTLGQLVAQASNDVSELMRAEIALAKAEVQVSVKNGVTAGAMFGIAAFLGLLATVLLSIAAAFGVAALGLAPGWAFLIVAVVFLLIAGILGLIGLRRVKRVKGPERAVASTKKTIETVKAAAS